MDRVARSSARVPRETRHLPAAEPTGSAPGRPGAETDNSPRLTAQRQSIRDSFGTADGLASAPLATMPAGRGPIQAYKTTRADDGGNFIGESGACHCHIDIGKPHFKVGKDDGTRINFGRDMNLARMQRAYDALVSQHAGKAGFDDCKEYLEEQGCTAPDPNDKVNQLKEMLLRWGGLSADKIHYFSESGELVEVPVYSADQLDETILAAETEIRRYDSTYTDWLEEQVEQDEDVADKNYHAGKKAVKAHQGSQ